MKEKILAKIEKGEDLTKEERMFYLVSMMGIKKDEAERMVYINDETTDGVTVD